MENASKALIMAAEILIGVIIVSIGVALFTMFANYSREATEKINESQINEFNSNFLKYDGSTSVSIHDIISLVNLAQANNDKYDLKFSKDSDIKEIENTMYVRVGIITGSKTLYMETWDESQKNDWIKNNSLIFGTDIEGDVTVEGQKYYKLSSYHISNVTKRICYVLFKEIN